MADEKIVMRDEHGRILPGSARINDIPTKRGRSWANVIERMSNLTPTEIAEYLEGKLAQQFREMGDSISTDPEQRVTIKELVAARVLAALMFEPTPGLWREWMDREDGPVMQKVEQKVEGAVIVLDHNAKPVRVEPK